MQAVLNSYHLDVPQQAPCEQQQQGRNSRNGMPLPSYPRGGGGGDDKKGGGGGDDKKVPRSEEIAVIIRAHQILETKDAKKEKVINPVSKQAYSSVAESFLSDLPDASAVSKQQNLHAANPPRLSSMERMDRLLAALMRQDQDIISAAAGSHIAGSSHLAASHQLSTSLTSHQLTMSNQASASLQETDKTDATAICAAGVPEWKSERVSWVPPSAPVSAGTIGPMKTFLEQQQQTTISRARERARETVRSTPEISAYHSVPKTHHHSSKSKAMTSTRLGLGIATKNFVSTPMKRF